MDQHVNMELVQQRALLYLLNFLKKTLPFYCDYSAQP